MKSVTVDVVAEKNQEACLGIQGQAGAEVSLLTETEVNHRHLLAKVSAGSFCM